MTYAKIVRYFDHNPHVAILVSEELAPLAGRIGAEHGMRGAWLRRGWRHGPHIDLVVIADDLAGVSQRNG